MTAVVIVAVVALLAQAATAALFIGFTRARARESARERREMDAERRDLVDRVMHMANHTWTPPPQLDYGEPEQERPTVIYPEQALPAGY